MCLSLKFALTKSSPRIDIEERLVGNAVLPTGWNKSIEDTAEDTAEGLFGESFGFEMAVEDQSGNYWPQCQKRRVMVCLLVAGELPEHPVMKPSVIGRLRHLEGFPKALLRFGMPESEELEFERQDRPRPIVDQPNNEFAKGFQALLSTRTLPQTTGKPINVRPGTMLKQSKEQIFLAFEVRIDRPFASVRCSGNLVELGRLIPIP